MYTPGGWPSILCKRKPWGLYLSFRSFFHFPFSISHSNVMHMEIFHQRFLRNYILDLGFFKFGTMFGAWDGLRYFIVALPEHSI